MVSLFTLSGYLDLVVDEYKAGVLATLVTDSVAVVKIPADVGTRHCVDYLLIFLFSNLHRPHVPQRGEGAEPATD